MEVPFSRCHSIFLTIVHRPSPWIRQLCFRCFFPIRWLRCPSSTCIVCNQLRRGHLSCIVHVLIINVFNRLASHGGPFRRHWKKLLLPTIDTVPKFSREPLIPMKFETVVVVSCVVRHASRRLTAPFWKIYRRRYISVQMFFMYKAYTIVGDYFCGKNTSNYFSFLNNLFRTPKEENKCTLFTNPEGQH